MNIFRFEKQMHLKNMPLFPEEIENDPWIIYHGTSCFNEEGIERDGFIWKAGNTPREVLSRVVDIFEKMQWAGLDSSSLAILKPYSLQHDFDERYVSPVYFAETSRRALLYATRDFAGGEKLRSLRKSFEHLQRYLDDPLIRQDHMQYLQHEYDYLERNGAYMPAYSKPVQVNLEWLSHELDTMEQISIAAKVAYDEHEYGVVYAIKLGQQDVEKLTYHNSMGIKATCCIDPGKIEAKAIVPGDFRLFSHGRSFEEVMMLESFSTGVYATLKRNEIV